MRHNVRTSNHPWIIREDTEEFGRSHRLGKPTVFVLEEPNNNMYALIRSLKAGGYSVHSSFEAAEVITKIVSAMHRHVLLLIAHRSRLPLRTNVAVQTLRRRGYEWPIVYCILETIITPKTHSEYKKLTVNKVLSVSAEIRSSILATLEWIREQVDFSQGGMTVLEF